MTGWKRRWARLKQKDKVLSLIGLAMKAGDESGKMHERRDDDGE